MSVSNEANRDFNPYGLHSIHIPLGLLTYPGISWGAKALYGRLALFRGRKQNGFCHPDRATLAVAMVGVHVNTIDTWLEELIGAGFIERRRRRRQSAEYVFRAHPCLIQDSQKTVNQEVLESQSTGLRVTNSRVLESQSTGFFYKEENIQGKHSGKTTSTCASDDARAHARPSGEPTEADTLFEVAACAKRSKRSRRGLTPQQENWFTEWWEIYWRKKNKKRAREAFGVYVQTLARHKQVMAATRAQTPAMMATEQRFRPHGASWLNDERWEDEPDQPAKLPPQLTNNSHKPTIPEKVGKVLLNRIVEEGKPWS
jgi:hypothetical protein